MKTGFFRMLIVASGAGLCFAPHASALNNGLARTPPMGFSTWNWFGCGDKGHGTLNDSLIRGVADAMVSSGMKDSGYQYLSIDDCWPEMNRDANGGLVPHRANFPRGMKSVADYVHSKGLKFGIYSSIGPSTCKGRPGMLNHESQDADSFAVWGVDYAKIDLCYPGVDTSPSHLSAVYTITRNALQGAVTRMKPMVPTAHEMVFSICTGPYGNAWQWGDTVGNLWRTGLDIDYPSNPPAGTCNGSPCWTGVLQNAETNAPLAKYAGPGKGWNDPDMLEVGNTPLTTAQSRSHFSLWCMMAAPLFAGNDVRNMSDSTRKILTNGEVIKVDQDSLGMQGARITAGNTEVWVKKLGSALSAKTDTDYAVLFFNKNNGAAASVTANQIASAVGGGITAGKVYLVRDLWSHKDLGEWTAGTYNPPAPIPNNDVFMIRLSPKTAVSIPARLRKSGIAFHIVNGERIVVEISRSVPASISLFDLKGALIGSKQSIGSARLTLDAAGIPQGLYLLTVKSGNESFSWRVLLGTHSAGGR